MRVALPTVLLAAAPAAAQSYDYPAVAGESVDVVCWFMRLAHGERMATDLMKLGDTLAGEASGTYGLDAPPQRVVMNAYEARVGKAHPGLVDSADALEPGLAEGTACVHHWETRGVHVKVQPVAGDPLTTEVGFPTMSLRKAGVELAHLLRRDATGGADLAPRWFARGSALWLADRALVSMGRAEADEACPAVSTRVQLVLGLRDTGRLPTIEEVLAGRPGDPEAGDLTEEEAVALESSLVRYLVDRLGREGFLRLGPRLTRAASAAEAEAHLRAALEGAEPAGDGPGIDAGFLGWLDARPAHWIEEVPGFYLHPEGRISVPFGRESGLTWAGLPPAKEYVVRAEVRILRNRNGIGQANVCLGRLPNGDYLVIALSTTEGVKAWTYDAASAGFNEMTRVEMGKGLRHQRWYRITVRVSASQPGAEPDRVTVFVRDLGDPDAKSVRMRPLPVDGRDMSGAWGVGCLANSATVWRDLTIEPYERADDGSDGGEGGQRH